MDENKELDLVMPGDEDDFLPDGWDGKSDLFADDGFNEDAFETDESEEAPAQEPEENGGDSGETGDLTKDAEDPGDDQSDMDGTEEAPDGAADKAKPVERILKLKVNHQEEELDVNALSDEELTALLQKGRAFDALKDTENKRRFRQVYQEQIDAGMTEAAAKLIAQNEAGGKEYPLTDDEPREEASSSETPQMQVQPARDPRAEIEQLKALYPNFKEVPDAVAKAWAAGVPLLSAWLAYRESENEKTAARLQKENDILRQNAAAAARAPVKGVSGGGETHQKVDNFIKGFDADPW